MDKIHPLLCVWSPPAGLPGCNSGTYFTGRVRSTSQIPIGSTVAVTGPVELLKQPAANGGLVATMLVNDQAMVLGGPFNDGWYCLVLRPGTCGHDRVLALTIRCVEGDAPRGLLVSRYSLQSAIVRFQGLIILCEKQERLASFFMKT